MRLHSFHIPHLKLHAHLRRSIQDLNLIDTTNYWGSLHNPIETSRAHSFPNPTKHAAKKSVRISLTHVTMLFDNSKGIFEEPLSLFANTWRYSPLHGSDCFVDLDSDPRIATPVTSRRSLDLSDSRFNASIARYERKASIAALRETSEQMNIDRDIHTGLYLGSSEAMLNTLLNLSMPYVESILSSPPIVLKPRTSSQPAFHFRSPRLVLSRATRAARHKLQAAKFGRSPDAPTRKLMCT